ncbi:hypothetical protein GCM10009819_10480 [Agromyces tropicus]|uniref:Uncharacterized protein n=1 Tax=Agromyces tropicus TaxID=555371 RepID=A0ABN2U5T4_9MICO
MTPALASVLALVSAAEDEFDPNDVTPGVIGFIVTIVIMGAVLLLVLDMVRRIRRVNYRAEARERIAAEQAEAEAHEADVADAADATTDDPTTDAAASDTPPADRD